MHISTAGLGDIGLISSKVRVYSIWVDKAHS